ncbi:MAG: NTP transferase domain-containing protein [Atopobiaceae bacterium]|nr:NTP transferase domain-containing protein [Atopobiaceae bacterium]
MKVDNAIIMAAGTSSRFAPLSRERHKGLTVVRGEVLIERQIEQLLAAGVPEIFLITGYKAEQFDYLPMKYGVKLIHNGSYLERNNHGSIWIARNVLANTYVCSSDNYFCTNPFESEVDCAYYAAEYANGPTAEWCMEEDAERNICSVTVGGENAWYMMGHAFWSEEFSRRFLEILGREYDLPGTADKLWETIVMEHLDVLKMRIRRYAPGIIFEFDTLDELRLFDGSYVDDTRSALIKKAARELGASEAEISHITSLKSSNTEAAGFRFDCRGVSYSYRYGSDTLEQIKG